MGDKWVGMILSFLNSTMKLEQPFGNRFLPLLRSLKYQLYTRTINQKGVRGKPGDSFFVMSDFRYIRGD